MTKNTNKNRRLYIVGNWKMNKTAVEADNFREEFIKALDDEKPSNIDIGICANYLVLERLKNWFSLLHNDAEISVDLGAQNINSEDKGAFTGEISAPMLKSFNIDLTIIGHSERREYYCEDDDVVNAKIKNALKNEMRVILCVGENLNIRDSKKENEFIKNQLQQDLKDIKDITNITIAYEPIWAIGTGKVLEPNDAEKMSKYIRETICEMYDQKTAEDIRILYGGSVKAENANDIFKKENIDGGLIGGASLDVNEFLNIIRISNKINK